MKNTQKPIELIRLVAKALEDLNDEAVFVGGTTYHFIFRSSIGRKHEQLTMLMLFLKLSVENRVGILKNN